MPRDEAVHDAAVLVPVYRGPDGDLRMVLVRRALGGVHGGQIAFPGGTPEAGDGSLLDTATREAREEIGLRREAIDVLAELPVERTNTSGYAIHPYLCRIRPPAAWRRDDREIEEVLDLALGDLARPEAQGVDPDGAMGPFYRVGAHRIWGATYRIVRPLLPRLQAGEWEIRG